MATPRAAIHRDLEQRLRDIETRLQSLASKSLRREQLRVTSGDFVVSGGGNIVILGADGEPVWDALSGPVRTDSAYNSDGSMNVNPDVFVAYGETNVPVPAGYSRGHVFMMVSAGTTFVTEGSLSVLPRAWGSEGPAINSGSGRVAVANSFWARDFSGVGEGTAWPTVDLSLRARRFGDADPGTGNWHLAASVMFLR